MTISDVSLATTVLWHHSTSPIATTSSDAPSLPVSLSNIKTGTLASSFIPPSCILSTKIGFACNISSDPCHSLDPCQNNGTCSSISPQRYTCSCPAGFSGTHCEQDRGLCHPHTCLGHGSAFFTEYLHRTFRRGRCVHGNLEWIVQLHVHEGTTRSSLRSDGARLPAESVSEPSCVPASTRQLHLRMSRWCLSRPAL